MTEPTSPTESSTPPGPPGPRVLVVDEPDHHRYLATVDGDEAGFLLYERSGKVIDLQHTIVEPHHQGQGVGSTLVRFALESARAADDRVIPTCPFVPPFLQRHPEFLDLVKR